MRATPAIRAIAASERGDRIRACARGTARTATAVLQGGRAALGRVAAIWLALLVALAPDARGATAHIQYLSSSSVYLDAGRAAGLAVGVAVRVERDGQVVAELVVEFVAQGSAACRIVTSTSPLRAGDLCTFTPAAPEPAPGSAATVAPGTAGRSADSGASGARPSAGTGAGTGSWIQQGAMGGSVALLYRRSSQADGSLSNPALRADVRWDGPDRRQLALRLRADRPVLDFDPSAGAATARPERTRLYAAELRYRGAGERLELAAGRILPARMEPMGYMDGAAVAYRLLPALQFGLLGGRGARLGPGGFEAGGYKLGGFVAASDARRGAPARWRALLGAARLEDPDLTRRQFVLLRADESFTARVRAYENVEVDVAPGWMRALGDPRVDLTNLTLGTQIAAHRKLDLALGFDSRRDLRQPEQRHMVAPAAELERTHGAYGAVHVRFSRSTALRLGGDFRRRSDGTRLTRAWDASARGSHPAQPQLTGTLHANFYDADPARGELYDAYLSWLATSRLRCDAAAGTHRMRGVPAATDGAADTRTNWLRAGVDLQLFGGLWIDATGEWRDRPASREIYFEIGQRF